MMIRSRQLVTAALFFLGFPELLPSQESRLAPSANIDTDSDGLSDAIETALLRQFAPQFMIDHADCSTVPAEFVPGLSAPKVKSEDGTIYGQVFPAKTSEPAKTPAAEIHFYHLWKQDCGAHGHPLDVEHVSVLVRASRLDLNSSTWKAVYWFAGAHENTVCDMSQIARASTLKAEEYGAAVWVSRDKHASFLNETLCNHGCGNDLCSEGKPLSITKIINLGEPGHPMNGSLWIASPSWSLSIKMARTDFPPAPVVRLGELPTTDIAWFNPGRHPVQGVIAISGSTADALGSSGENTASAISLASDSTENALQKSYGNTVHALGSSASHVGKFLRLGQKPE